MPKSLFPDATAEIREELEQDSTLRLLNDYNWSSNVLGPIPTWPESLKGATRLIMAASTPMVMLVGPEGILIYNDAYAEFAGTRHPDIFGMPAVEAWPEIADFNREKIALGMRGEHLILRDQELSLNRHGNPESGWMDLHYSPLLNEAGLPMGVLCMVHETTERVMTEKALARSEERLSLALSGSDLVGTWDWDIAQNLITSDDKFAALYNIDPLQAGLGVTLEDFLKAIHPEDAERVGQQIAESLTNNINLRSEYRVVAPDGAIRWVIASGRPRYDVDGKPMRFPGVAVDVTEQHAVSERLAESDLRFRTLADTMPQMVWSTLPDGFHDYYNARWYDYTGVHAGSTDGEGWNDMFHPDDQARARQTWQHSLSTGEPYEIEYRLRHHSGNYRWTLGRALPIRDDNGQIIRWFGTCTDIHETRTLAEERELVAQELSHRIKNIFAVLTGIVSLSARSRPDIKPFADDLRQRIYALGEAHDFVRPHSQNSSRGDDQSSLKALIARLMQPYHAGDTARVEFAGTDATIDDGAATPLALLFHELGTNSAKYGALSVSTGRVQIASNLTDNSLVLSWKESGGPAVAPTQEHTGFGSRLISLSVEGQMRGKLERLWEADGLRVNVELPIDALQRTAKLQQGT